MGAMYFVMPLNLRSTKRANLPILNLVSIFLSFSLLLCPLSFTFYLLTYSYPSLTNVQHLWPRPSSLPLLLIGLGRFEVFLYKGVIKLPLRCYEKMVWELMVCCMMPNLTVLKNCPFRLTTDCLMYAEHDNRLLVSI